MKTVKKLPRVYFAALAAAGCMAMGIGFSAKLSARVAALTAWARVLVRLEAGLSYRVHTMEEMIRKAGEAEAHADVKTALLQAAGAMRENPLTPLSEAMRGRAVDALTPGDGAALAPLFQGLGADGEPSQRNLIRAVRAAVDIQIAEAREAEARNRRLAHSLGLIGGLAVFLFLL